MAGKKRDRVGKILVAQLCTFEGENLTADEIGTELPNADVVHLTNLLFGADASSASRALSRSTSKLRSPAISSRSATLPLDECFIKSPRCGFW